MNPRIIAAIVAATSLFAVAGCASTTPAAATAAAPGPVVAFKVPAHETRALGPSRFESTPYQMTHTLGAVAVTRPLASHR